MIITITVEDFERDIYFKATGFDFDSAETELGRLERNYNAEADFKDEAEFTNETPLGGVVEKYDIEREKDLTN